MPRPEATTSFDAIGTRWAIDTPEPLPDAVLQAVRARIDRFDRDWSRFRDDSWVAEVARGGAGSYRLPDDAGPLLDAYDAAARCTDGAVSPLVGRALEGLGYDAAYTLRPRRDDGGALLTAPAPDWRTAARRSGGTLTLDEPALLDVGAAGKGYLVDLVSGVLADHGVGAHVVDAGGDLRVVGLGAGAAAGGPLTVALEDPRDTTRALGVLRLTDGALCGSATNRRAWGPGLHHVVDARTGAPTTDVLATWAVGGSALAADAAATALFFAEPDLVASRFGIRYVVLRADGSLRWSLGLDGKVFA
ncbi:FAD:protein FMN transferase [Cellulomonas pakistanensis]|uniref:FAD:protein FMN transferase n=1 Tax=Cellulomonas pakistanensis TaxID=992287 RepID=A0A919PBV9_9CELL|nr:FAD:protein FMN transferase [Cellulomonas pakistanensis]GIG36843.1 FAD:protein FMN transferase [Cellulomonas pakistanensis]